MRSMTRQTREERRLDAIRSVSIEDIVYGRHTRWRRFVRRARQSATAVTALAAATALGAAVYFVAPGPGETMLVAPAPAVALSAPDAHAPLDVPPLQAIAGLDAAPAPSVSAGPTPILPATPFAAEVVEISAPAAAPAPPASEPVDLARLPTPRPDEPIVTGSIARADDSGIEQRRFRPCRTLQRWTSHLPFPRITCGT